MRQASANHRTITEAIAREISEINDHVYSCSTLLDLYPNERMQRMTVKLYCYIFDFFERITQWLKSRWQRFRRSFSDDSVETLKDLSTDIKRHIQALHRTAEVGHKVEGRMTNIKINELQRQVASQNEYLEKTWSIVNELNNPRRQQEMLTQISIQMFHLLQGKDWLHNNVGSNPYLRAGDDMSVCETVEDNHSPLLLPRSLSRAGSERGEELEGGFNPFESSPTPCHIDADVVASLQNWLTKPRPTFFWVSGSAETDENRLPQSVAHAFVRSAVQCGTPLLWHSCAVRGGPQSQSEARVESFLRLLNSMKQQLIRLSRPTRPPSPRYPLGDGQDQDSTDDALDTLESLLANAPPVLFCSIDEFDVLEDPSEDNTHLLSFLRVLRKYGDRCISSSASDQDCRVFKMLVTSRGQSWALSGELDPDEMCIVAEDWRTSMYPGEEAPGRVPLSLAPTMSSLSLSEVEKDK
jgi:hypothetical protein